MVPLYLGKLWLHPFDQYHFIFIMYIRGFSERQRNFSLDGTKIIQGIFTRAGSNLDDPKADGSQVNLMTKGFFDAKKKGECSMLKQSLSRNLMLISPAVIAHPARLQSLLVVIPKPSKAP